MEDLEVGREAARAGPDVAKEWLRAANLHFAEAQSSSAKHVDDRVRRHAAGGVDASAEHVAVESKYTSAHTTGHGWIVEVDLRQREMPQEFTDGEYFTAFTMSPDPPIAESPGASRPCARS